MRKIVIFICLVACVVLYGISYSQQPTRYGVRNNNIYYVDVYAAESLYVAGTPVVASTSTVDTDTLTLDSTNRDIQMSRISAAKLGMPFGVVIAGDSLTVRMSLTSDPTDSLLIFTTPSGVPTITGIATDGDVSTITWNTSDQIVFSGASGGYDFDVDPSVSGTTAWADSNNITDNGIGNEDLQVNSVTTTEIRDGTITGTDVSSTTQISVSSFVASDSLNVGGGVVMSGYSHVGSSRNTTVSDYIIGVSSDDAAITITLDTDTVTAGRTIQIKDEDGNASTNNITIATEGAETIDGSATLTIDVNYNSVSLYSDGSNWFIF